jgi:hypothetical protein
MTTKIPVELSSTPGIVDGSNETAITIDSSENVHVGGTDAAFSGTKLVSGGYSSNLAGLSILNSTTGTGYVLFGDGAGSAGYVGQISYSHTNGAMNFVVEGASAQYINSSRNVGIGTTSPSARLEVDASAVGEIVRIAKSGNRVGSIGASNNASSDLTIFSSTASHIGLQFGNTRLHPTDNAGATTDDVCDIGGSTTRFNDIYATNATIQTSDRNEKNTIVDSDLGLDFVKRLSPKSYKFNGKTRTHYGLIAQDIETVLSDISKSTSDFAGFIKDDISEELDGSEYRYGLRYTEFVAPLVKAIQEQQEQIEQLKTEIQTLKGE